MTVCIALGESVDLLIMRTRLLLIVALALICGGCADAAGSPPQAASEAAPAPPQTVATQTSGTGYTLPATSSESFLISETDGDAPPSFDRVAYGRGVCTGLRQGYTMRQLHEGLMTMGLNRTGATHFQSTAVLMICPELRGLIPAQENEWWQYPR